MDMQLQPHKPFPRAIIEPKTSFRMLFVPYGLLVALFLAYSMLLAFGSVAGFPPAMQSDNRFPYLSDKPVAEDGYYMLTVARNLAHGEGLVYNGNVSTTGIQPLNTLVQAAIVGVVEMFSANQWTIVRAVLVYGALLQVVFAILIARITWSLASPRPHLRQAAAFLAFALALFNTGLFRLFTYGLETGLYLVMLGVLVHWFQRQQIPLPFSWKQTINFAALAGITLLVRIDFGVLLVTFCLAALMRRQISFVMLLIAGLLASIIALPWFWYIWSITGSPIPSSGTAQAGVVTLADIPQRTQEMARSLISHALPWIYSRPSMLLAVVSALALVGILLLSLYRRDARATWMASIRATPFLTEWILALSVVIPVYFLFFRAVHFYTRYTAPVSIVLIPLLAGAVILLTERVPWIQRAAQYSTVLAFYTWILITLHTGSITNPQSVMAGFVHDHYAAPVRVGAFQSGVIGFFNPNVVNLDGKVNQDVLEHIERNTVGHYLDQMKIEVLIDWPEVIGKRIDAEYLRQNWLPCDFSVPDGKSLCFVRTPVGD